ncbi:SDR family NAD(P)-dependent oxidoreductase [Notoacmeibacter ruber]|uniref:SDR family oxidoreductase n=1 Tax=Notoacmeibacter ruber TaxID=2670375 RepID=A0A3L7JJR2_9HYPH|nr:SDR family oxidoreductase [Notoacmeibacter ruber]RLQ88722.1 SDR family oxidoreductase [Notoacmeibacter ruber]
MSVDGRAAIVTGGASGIGLAIARQLAKEGARVVIADMDHDMGESAAEELQPLGNVQFIRTDVSKRLDVHNLMALAIDHFDEIDILVNNAAVMERCPFLDIHEEGFRRVLDVNVMGAFLTTQAAAKIMVDQAENGRSPGAIVNISSLNGRVAMGGQMAYCVSKGAMDQLTRSAAVELAPWGIRVNGVAPGTIATDMVANLTDRPGMRDQILSRTPLGRLGDPSEVAELVSFLVSGRSAYMTGETVLVDGGRRALNLTLPSDSE